MNRDADKSKMPDAKVAYIIGTYPLLTTTFIDREIELLRRRGLALDIYSIRRPPPALSPEQERLQSDVTYLLPVSFVRLLLATLTFMSRRPLAMARTLLYLLSRPHPSAKARLKTTLHFAAGVYAAYHMRRAEIDHLHAHFVDRAATVALVASRLLQLPYSATAHANDIYVEPVLLPEKIAGAKFIATCTGYNLSHLQRIVAAHLPDDAARIRLRRIYHGLDLQQYAPAPQKLAGPPHRLLAVGQLKEKKGFTHLLGACRRLKERGYAFECKIVGEGPLRNRLQAQIAQEGLADIVALCGARPHRGVIDYLRNADIFTLPSVLAADGDRDGIPNVILEAMAMELPVVATNHSGIPEVVEDKVNGLLVPPGDEEALANALAHLFDCPNLRQQMGREGRKTVEERFTVEANVAQLLQEFLTDGRRETAADTLASALFLVWGPPSHGPRSRVFARELGIRRLHFVYSTMRRGLLVAPVKYSYQTIATLRLLWRLRPELIFVQSPPSLAVLVVYLYCRLRNSHYIVDAHSDAFTSPFWSRPVWLQRLLARRAVTTIVTNQHFQQLIRRWGAHAFILRDIPTRFPDRDGFPVEGQFNVVVVNTFAEDEPLAEILQAAEALGHAPSPANGKPLPDAEGGPDASDGSAGIHFYITGKTSRAPQQLAGYIAGGAQRPPNVHFTGFLPDDDYYALLNSADAVMCLTTRNHTMQRGACEALSLGRPIITSDWPLLKSYFARGTVHVDNSVNGIRAGVLEMAAKYERYCIGIRELQKDQMQEWHDKMILLNALVADALEPTQ